MAKDLVGTIRNVTIEGIPFRCAGDTNLTQIFTKYENTLVPTSGKPIRKMVQRIQAVEGLTLILNASEREELKSFAENPGDIKLSYTTMAGDTYKAEGTIEVENIDSDEGRATVKMLPNGDWTPFFG